MARQSNEFFKQFHTSIRYHQLFIKYLCVWWNQCIHTHTSYTSQCSSKNALSLYATFSMIREIIYQTINYHLLLMNTFEFVYLWKFKVFFIVSFFLSAITMPNMSLNIEYFICLCNLEIVDWKKNILSKKKRKI